MNEDILFEAIVFLVGAIICVPIAKKLGLSSVLGYLLAGVLIGPYLLGFIGEEGNDIQHFAEFGVVMMLFLIGLEIDAKSFWKMRKTIVGMGGTQVVLTSLISFAILIAFGVSWQVSLTCAMAISMSSTAITLQTISEKNLMNTTYGASSFAILLFQDIIVIVMLGLLPLLSTIDASKLEGEGSANILKTLPLGWQALATVSAIVLIVISGRYLIIPVLRLVAISKVRELLTAAALLIVLAITYLMEFVGLSPALGAFLGGVVLATSEFKHELESTLEPFKGLLLGLFFITVGTTINFVVIADNPLVISGLVVGIILVKGLVLYIVATLFKLKINQKFLLAVGLAQIGEFAFVMLSFALQLHILDQKQLDIMLVVTALTMALTPILGLLSEKLILPKFGTKQAEEKPADAIERSDKIILVGFGHFGSTVGRFLRAHGVKTTILDQDSSRVDLLRKMGFEVFYGDATRLDLLESAGIANAEILICAIDNPEVTLSLIKKVKEKYPHLKLMVRARNRDDAYDLLNNGVDHIYRESLDTSIKLASDVLQHIGFDAEATRGQADKFIRLDEESMRRLARAPKTGKEYVFKAREEMEQQEKLLEEDQQVGSSQLKN
ncbi:monovalent cation:proton antiporter-2 (CPA2) family protein [Cellulophaga sp. E16_2]|uniref:monovalent cation:proton antiporter-2 (CPA2) family protein n=1 Tax=Cellulophaga sp. E16_2 TaxID=2789297 RepID=UPI002103C0D7|nr:monovalent cation:proton antiporter-2 (CPA2) family protein [Cellulophaga sp. E16_2]